MLCYSNRTDNQSGHISDRDRNKIKTMYHSLLGMENFYRRHIPTCAKIITPTMELSKG